MNNVVVGTNRKLLTLPSDQDNTGRTLGEEEIRTLTEAIYSGTLTSTKGRFVKTLEQQFGSMLGVRGVVACASGTGAVHAAIAAIDPEPGDEIITTSITDMGALAPILYQGAIPVFADVDPKTSNVTAHTIERCLSSRTKAIVVTHLFGNPCEMGGIMALARRAGVPVIEDCAQAFLAKHDGQHVGTIGDIGCFSLQQGKHITTGEGGLAISNNPALARRMFLFVNKAWGYGDAHPDHYFLGLNYRLSELQGAVAAAQLPKLEPVVEARIHMAGLLTRKLRAIPGIETPYIAPSSVHTYWKYCLMVDPTIVPGGSPALGKRLLEWRISCAPRYIQKPAFECEIFQKRRTFGNSQWPFTLARPEAVNYDPSLFPGTWEALNRILVLPWNEKYTEEHVDYLADSIREALDQLVSAA